MVKVADESFDITRPIVLNCDQGRAMGCASFCCSLIVRLDDDERDPTMPENSLKHCVDKDPETGRCIHQNLSNGLCRIWERRPRICREYDCNKDDCLQLVLRDGFRSLMKLVLTENDKCGKQRCVPYVED